MLIVIDSLEPVPWASLLIQLSAHIEDIYHHWLIIAEKVPYACSSLQMHLSLSYCNISPNFLSLHGSFPSKICLGGIIKIVSGSVVIRGFCNIFSSSVCHVFRHMQCKKLCTQEIFPISLNKENLFNLV